MHRPSPQLLLLPAALGLACVACWITTAQLVEDGVVVGTVVAAGWWISALALLVQAILHELKRTRPPLRE